MTCFRIFKTSQSLGESQTSFSDGSRKCLRLILPSVGSFFLVLEFLVVDGAEVSGIAEPRRDFFLGTTIISWEQSDQSELHIVRTFRVHRRSRTDRNTEKYAFRFGWVVNNYVSKFENRTCTHAHTLYIVTRYQSLFNSTLCCGL